MIELQKASYRKDFSYELDFEINRELQVHKSLEVLYVLEGQVDMQVNGKFFLLKTDDVLVLNAYEVHQIHCQLNTHILSLFLGEGILGENYHSYKCCSREKNDPKIFADLKQYLADMFRLYNKDCEANREDIFSKAHQMLAFLQKHFDDPEHQNIPPKKNLELIDNVLRYINENYTRHLSLSGLAKMFFVSEAHLSKVFKKYLKIPFVQYLRELRLQNIYLELLENKHEMNVTELALYYGFSNANTMIAAFRKKYGVTPGKIKNTHAGARQVVVNLKGGIFSRFMSYASDYENLVKGRKKQIRVRGCCRDSGKVRSNSAFELMNIGWAKELLLKEIQEQIHLCQNKIGFRYLRCHGIFDDDMHVYSVDDKGNDQYNFFYIDQAYDFLEKEKLLPYVELGYIPSAMARSGKKFYWNQCVIGLPDKLEKWEKLITAYLRHCIWRYGADSVRKWKFTLISGLYAYLSIYTFEEYMQLFEVTYRAVKSVDPKLQVGGPGIQMELSLQKSDNLLKKFLDEYRKRGCMPDFITLEFFHGIYSWDKKTFMQKVASHRQEPMMLSEDPDYMAACAFGLKRILEQEQLLECPVVLEAWNSTLWQRDLTNDTCFKAAFLVKNILENSMNFQMMGYWVMSDLMGELFGTEEIFHGGYGLVTQNGIPKSGFNAYVLLRMMGERELKRSEGIVITKKSDAELQIAMYNYCHFDTLTRQHVFAEGSKTSRYLGFQNEGMNEYEIELELLPGNYQVTQYRIGRERGFGSGYDTWVQIGAPETLDEFQKEYLTALSQPHYTYSIEDFSAGSIRLRYCLKPHEVYVICLRRVSKVLSECRTHG